MENESIIMKADSIVERDQNEELEIEYVEEDEYL